MAGIKSLQAERDDAHQAWQSIWQTMAKLKRKHQPGHAPREQWEALVPHCEMAAHRLQMAQAALNSARRQHLGFV